MFKHLLSSITLLLLSTLAFGQVPNTFSSGETISSSKINANFSFLANAMAGGNVTAMMACRGIHIGDTQNLVITHEEEFISPQILFSKCLAPDNTTLSNINGCVLGYSLENGNCYSGGSKKRSIFSKDLIENGWVLSYIDKWGDGENNIYYYFYKVSSD